MSVLWQGLVASVLNLLGLEEAGTGNKETLAALGMDSLQMVEIRATVQSAIGRPLPIEKVYTRPHFTAQRVPKPVMLMHRPTFPVSRAS